MKLRFFCEGPARRTKAIVGVYSSLLWAMTISVLCPAGASGQIVDTSATCNGTSGQTYSNICFPNPQSGVMSGSTNAYVVYYGHWTSSTQTIINNWLATIGGTGPFGVTSAYEDFSGTHVQNVVNYNSSTNSYVDYQNPGNDYQTLGTQLNGDAAIQTIVSDAINGGYLPADTNGVYFVLTASNVTQINSKLGTFCGNYIAYHNKSTSIVSGETIKYALVGNPLQCPGFDGNIANGDSTTPNGNVAADGTINLIFHELAEAVTDPVLGSWGATSPQVNESGDMCEWEFGTWSLLPTASNGAHYNVTIAGVNYLIQKLFQVAVLGTPTPATFYPGTCAIRNITLTSSPNPSVVGQPVTLTATVSGLAGMTPTGTVTFYFGYGYANNSGEIGGTNYPGNPATLIDGQASFVWIFNAAKNPAYIYAVYSGDSNYDPSYSPMLYQVINQ